MPFYPSNNEETIKYILDKERVAESRRHLTINNELFSKFVEYSNNKEEEYNDYKSQTGKYIKDNNMRFNDLELKFNDIRAELSAYKESIARFIVICLLIVVVYVSYTFNKYT